MKLLCGSRGCWERLFYSTFSLKCFYLTSLPLQLLAGESSELQEIALLKRCTVLNSIQF